MNKFKITKYGQRKLKCFLWFHDWNKFNDTGITQYWECLRCGRKEIIQYTDGCYQPIDYSFLNI